MKKVYCFILLIIFSSAAVLFSFEWPVDDVVIKKTFGENCGETFNEGILLGGGSQEVHTIDSGTVIYSHLDGYDLSGIPSGLGNFVVIEHERSLVSLYAHLEPSNPPQGAVRAGEKIGISGRSGEAPGVQLYLEIVDKEFNRMVNPFLILPSVSDTLDPVIEDVVIMMDQPYSLSLNEVPPSGEGEVLVRLYDPSQYMRFFRPMAPYRINIFANGEELFYQSFEAIESRDGSLRLVSQGVQRSFSDLYADTSLYRTGLHTFNPGETILEVIVADFFGNTVTETYRIKIQEGE